jgi:NRPS condensation-like uncharacterized protein
MLRATFSQDASGKWHQSISGSAASTECVWVSNAKSLDEMESEFARASILNVRNGPVFGAVFSQGRVEGHRQLLFMTAHHLVVDLVSWRIIIDELEHLL